MSEVAIGTPRQVAWARVAAAARHAHRDRPRTDRTDLVAGLLSAEGLAVADVHTEGRGYDIHASRGREQRLVEVKGLWDAASSQGVSLTANGVSVPIENLPLDTFDARTRFALAWARLYRRSAATRLEARWQVLAADLTTDDLNGVLSEADKGVRLAPTQASREEGRHGERGRLLAAVTVSIHEFGEVLWTCLGIGALYQAVLNPTAVRAGNGCGQLEVEPILRRDSAESNHADRFSYLQPAPGPVVRMAVRSRAGVDVGGIRLTNPGWGLVRVEGRHRNWSQGCADVP